MRPMLRAAAFATCLTALGHAVARADDPTPLPGTKALTLEGDVTSQLVDGVDRFLLKKTDESVARRAAFWKGEGAVETNRKRLASILGVTDPRVPFNAPELVGTTDRPALIGKGEGYEVFTVRWPAFGDVYGEGLLLTPTGRARVADVVAIPDADQTPEQIAGLAPGAVPSSPFARRLAENGCRVLVPVLIDRKVEARNGRAKLTTREYLYRSAFELGRTPTGYEIQKVLAAVDWFVKDAKGADPKIGVIGWGEGGRVAFYAAALDTRIDAACISGYFGAREGLWKEPLDRNVFGLLERFGDAEVAAHLISPRAYVIEASKAPDVMVPPNTGGGPGRITTPNFDAVRAEFDRALALRPMPITPPGGDHRSLVGSEDGFKGDPFDGITLSGLLRDLNPGGSVVAVPDKGPPKVLAPPPDPDARAERQTHEIVRHNEWLLAECAEARKAYFSKLDTRSLDGFKATIEPYRAAFRDDVIGRFDDPLLPANARTRKVYDEPKYTGYEVVLDVYPEVIAYGLLLVPKGIKEGEKRPVVVCQHGLEGRPQDVADPKVESPYYHSFANKLAERGFVTFAPQNLYIFHDRFRTLQRKANPLKKTLFSVIVPQHQQTTDWLKTLPFVDGARIAFYGLSYGGKSAMRIPPLVANYCLSICSGDFNEWVKKNASTRESYSYVWTPEYEIFEFDLGHTFNYAEMAALIAPRPFMVERGHFDGVGVDEEVAFEFAKVRFLYEAKLGIGDRCELEWFVGPHTIHGVGTYDFLHKHLHWPKP